MGAETKDDGDDDEHDDDEHDFIKVESVVLPVGTRSLLMYHFPKYNRCVHVVGENFLAAVHRALRDGVTDDQGRFASVPDTYDQSLDNEGWIVVRESAETQPLSLEEKISRYTESLRSLPPQTRVEVVEYVVTKCRENKGWFTYVDPASSEKWITVNELIEQAESLIRKQNQFDEIFNSKKPLREQIETFVSRMDEMAKKVCAPP